MTQKVALLDSINPAASHVFSERGFEVIEFPKSLSVDELSNVVSDVKILGIRSGPKIPETVIDSGNYLEAIGCFCVGTNHVDHSSANKNGIAIFNSVHENTRSVAEHVIASTFSLMRRIAEHSRAMHDGVWTKTDEDSYELRGKTLGIIGYGAIGGQVSVMAESIGMDVVYYDPAPQIPPQGRAKRLDKMEEVLESSHVVTLHVPGGERTSGMINKDTISIMQKGSYIINTSRGEVVDYDAVANAIESGQLGGVAADVFENEPSKRGDKFEHILRGVDRAVLTPHIAGSTTEAQKDIGKKIALKLFNYSRTGDSVGSVNLPELPLSSVPNDTFRILNIHDNVPGVMANIGSAIAEFDLNVVSSIQKARNEIGYAAFDVDGTVPQDLNTSIQELSHSLKTRVIG